MKKVVIMTMCVLLSVGAAAIQLANLVKKGDGQVAVYTSEKTYKVAPTALRIQKEGAILRLLIDGVEVVRGQLGNFSANGIPLTEDNFDTLTDGFNTLTNSAPTVGVRNSVLGDIVKKEDGQVAVYTSGNIYKLSPTSLRIQREGNILRLLADGNEFIRGKVTDFSANGVLLTEDNFDALTDGFNSFDVVSGTELGDTAAAIRTWTTATLGDTAAAIRRWTAANLADSIGGLREATEAKYLHKTGETLAGMDFLLKVTEPDEPYSSTFELNEDFAKLESHNSRDEENTIGLFYPHGFQTLYHKASEDIISSVTADDVQLRLRFEKAGKRADILLRSAGEVEVDGTLLSKDGYVPTYSSAYSTKGYVDGQIKDTAAAGRTWTTANLTDTSTAIRTWTAANLKDTAAAVRRYALDLVEEMENLHFEKVETLPEVGQGNVIYLVYDEEYDAYDEYIWVIDEGGYELIGRANIDLSWGNISGKPFSAVGANLTVTDDKLTTASNVPLLNAGAQIFSGTNVFQNGITTGIIRPMGSSGGMFPINISNTLGAVPLRNIYMAQDNADLTNKEYVDKIVKDTSTAIRGWADGKYGQLDGKNTWTEKNEFTDTFNVSTGRGLFSVYKTAGRPGVLSPQEYFDASRFDRISLSSSVPDTFSQVTISKSRVELNHQSENGEGGLALGMIEVSSLGHYTWGTTGQVYLWAVDNDLGTSASAILAKDSFWLNAHTRINEGRSLVYGTKAATYPTPAANNEYITKGWTDATYPKYSNQGSKSFSFSDVGTNYIGALMVSDAAVSIGQEGVTNNKSASTHYLGGIIYNQVEDGLSSDDDYANNTFAIRAQYIEIDSPLVRTTSQTTAKANEFITKGWADATFKPAGYAPAWGDVTGKPFSTIGTNLSVTNNVLNAKGDVTTQQLKDTSTAIRGEFSKYAQLDGKNEFTASNVFKVSDSFLIRAASSLGDESIRFKFSPSLLNGSLQSTFASNKIEQTTTQLNLVLGRSVFEPDGVEASLKFTDVNAPKATLRADGGITLDGNTTISDGDKLQYGTTAATYPTPAANNEYITRGWADATFKPTGYAPAWGDVTGKPFSTIGSGLAVTDGVLSANTSGDFMKLTGGNTFSGAQTGTLGNNEAFQLTGSGTNKMYFNLTPGKDFRAGDNATFVNVDSSSVSLFANSGTNYATFYAYPAGNIFTRADKGFVLDGDVVINTGHKLGWNSVSSSTYPTPTANSEYVTKGWTDLTYVTKAGTNAFTGTNSFTNLPTSNAIPTASNQLVTKVYVDGVIDARHPRNFIAITGSNMSYSSDGVAWRGTGDNVLNCIRALNGQYIMIRGNDMVYTSLNGKDWASQFAGGSYTMYDLTYREGWYVALVGYGVYISSTLTAWSYKETFQGNSMQDITSGPQGYAAVHWNRNTIYTATDERALSWTAYPISGPSGFNDVAYGNGVYVAAGYQGYCSYSVNLTNWITKQLDNTETWQVVTYSDELHRWVMLGKKKFAYSNDGISWTLGNLPTEFPTLNDLTYGEGVFVAVGGGNTFLWSENGTAWAVSYMPANDYIAIAHLHIPTQEELLLQRIEALERRSLRWWQWVLPPFFWWR